MKRSIVMVVVAIAGTGLFPVMPPVQAQVEPDEQVCMARMSTGNPGGDTEQRITVDPPQVAWLEARGFAVRSCAGFSNTVSESMIAICQSSRLGDAALNSEFLAINGLTPVEMCELGERM